MVLAKKKILENWEKLPLTIQVLKYNRVVDNFGVIFTDFSQNEDANPCLFLFFIFINKKLC
jgi:hypothetical protein